MLTSQQFVPPAHMEFIRQQGYSRIAFIDDLLASQKREVHELLGELGIPLPPQASLHFTSGPTQL